jgi:hypothetical protein
MRFARGDLRTRIDSYKNDHRPRFFLISSNAAQLGSSKLRQTHFRPANLKVRTEYVVVELSSRVVVVHAGDQVLLGLRKAT